MGEIILMVPSCSIPSFSLCLFFLVFKNSVAPSPLQTFIKYLTKAGRSPLRFLFLRFTQNYSAFKCSSLLIILMAHCWTHCSVSVSCNGKVRAGHGIPDKETEVLLHSGSGTSFVFLSPCLLMYTWLWFTFSVSCTTDSCSKPGSPASPGPSLKNCVIPCQHSACIVVWNCVTLHLPSSFLPAQFFRLLESTEWQTALSSSLSTCPSQFNVVHNVLLSGMSAHTLWRKEVHSSSSGVLTLIMSTDFPLHLQDPYSLFQRAIKMFLLCYFLCLQSYSACVYMLQQSPFSR